MEREFCSHGLQESILLKCPYYPKQSTDSLQSQLKFLVIFKEIEQIILKFVWNHTHTHTKQISKAILRKKNKAGDITLSDFKQYYHAIKATKAIWYWHKNRHIDQWNRIEPRNKLPFIKSINLQHRRQEYTMWKESLFNKWFWKNWTAACKRMKLDHFLIPYTKINSKWVKQLNIRPETMKFLEENIGSMLFNIILSNNFLYLSPQAIAIK